MAHGWHAPPLDCMPQQMPLLSPVENTGLLSPFSTTSQDTQHPNPALFDNGNAESMVPPQSEDSSPKAILPYPPSHPIPQHSRVEQGPSNRRTNSRIQRARRYRRIITQSSQYRAYRTKQDQQQDGQKWSADLEEAFLDGILPVSIVSDVMLTTTAFLDVPMMGKLMFQINGKPHGRNQLIALYMWISYEKSLPPNVRPDRTKRRTQKQVSSHIQVLKGYIKTDPAFQHIFRSAEAMPKCTNRDMLNSDPCLIALANNTLPHWRSAPSPSVMAPIQPFLFDLCMSIPRANGHYERLYEYLDPEPLGLGPSSIEEALPNWRRQFSKIEHDPAVRDFGCSLIHVDVSLALRYVNTPQQAELWGSFEIAIPANDSHLKWRSVQTVQRHMDLFGDSGSDMHISTDNSPLHFDRFEEGSGAIMRLAFPALPWAQALGKMDDAQKQFEESQQVGHYHPVQPAAHQYIDQITMYQDIFSSADHGHSWTKRAVFVWTFNKTNQDERGLITWRQIHTPLPQALLSPQPNHNQGLQTTMDDSFSTMARGPLLSIEPVYYNPMPNPLITPSNSSAQPSPFSQYENPTPQDIVPDNMFFMPHNPHESGESIIGHQAQQHINYMVDGDPSGLHGFDQDANMWQPRPNPHRFGNDAFLSSYSTPIPTGCIPQDFKGNWRGAQELDGWSQRPCEQPCVQN
ncbi:hypothetical protein V490_02127 [Pseudogymnoascus sp. VKM F-3557]|nr:hypothetical protein V490_02127 [Pseudogymnoascus sp. VKM F-3557]